MLLFTFPFAVIVTMTAGGMCGLAGTLGMTSELWPAGTITGLDGAVMSVWSDVIVTLKPAAGAGPLRVSL